MRLRARREICPDHLAHPLDRRAIVADHFVDFIGEKIAHRALDQDPVLRRREQGAGRSLICLLDLRPLLEQETQIAHEIAGALSFADGANDDANAFGNFELAQDLAQARRAPSDLRSCARCRCDRCRA